MRGPKGAAGPAHPRAAADPRWVFKAHGGASLLLRLRREKERKFLGPALSALGIWFLRCLLTPDTTVHKAQSLLTGRPSFQNGLFLDTGDISQRGPTAPSSGFKSQFCCSFKKNLCLA